MQSFTLTRDSTKISGTNVHGIFRAPRAEGTEAILIMAPLYTSNGKRTSLVYSSKYQWRPVVIFICTILQPVFILV